MPGTQWAPFREGNRSEYLAQYFLSALGVSAPVPRQEDIGIDFYCALARTDDRRLTFHSPFTVQVGSEGMKQFSYGGLDKHGRWQKEQVEWIFSQELPLFICTVDKKLLQIKLYATSPMWIVRYSHGMPSHIILEPDNLSAQYGQKDVPEYKNTGGDGKSYAIPLGAPIVKLSLPDLATDDKITAARNALSQAVATEIFNLTYRRLTVHFCQWLINVPTPAFGMGYFYAWNTTPGSHTSEQLKAMFPILISLAHNYKAQNKSVELMKLKDVFKLYAEGSIPDFVKTNIPEFF